MTCNGSIRILIAATSIGLALAGRPAFAAGDPQNTPPTATIRSPVDQSYFTVGRTVSLAAAASDDRDPPESLTYKWSVDLVHTDHVVADAFSDTGAVVSFRVDNVKEETGFSLAIHLTVTDTEGLTDTATATIFPRLEGEPANPLFPGDVLQITVYAGGEKQEAFTTEVSAGGTITSPLIGEMAVASSTAADLSERLTAVFGRDYYVNPQVLVSVEEHAQKVFISGEVQKPGSYSIKDGATLLNACILAGGFTDFAALNRVVVTRTVGDSTSVIQVDLTKVQKGKARDLALATGDQIHVAHKRF